MFEGYTLELWRSLKLASSAKIAPYNKFAQLLELCLAYEVSVVEAALVQIRTHAGRSVDTVRLLNFASAPEISPAPLDPSHYPSYQGMTTPPNLLAYNRLLEMQP